MEDERLISGTNPQEQSSNPEELPVGEASLDLQQNPDERPLGGVKLEIQAFPDDIPISSHPDDERPIGGGGSYKIPEFSEEIPVSSNPDDERPIGGGGQYQIPEFSEEVPVSSNPDDERPLGGGGSYKVPDTHPGDERPLGGGGGYKIPEYPEDERPLGGGSYKTPDVNLDDERPLGGGSYKIPDGNPDDERPLGGGSYKIPEYSEDERPLGGGQNIPEYPEDERPIVSQNQANPADDERPLGGSNQGVIQIGTEDEIAVGRSGGIQIPEFQEQEQVVATGPLEKRVVSPKWDVRSQAFQELAEQLRIHPQELSGQYRSMLVKFIADKHPGAQEKALDVVKAYTEIAPEVIIENCDKIVREIVDKVLTSMRPNVKQLAVDLLLDIYSIHKDDFEGFNEGLSFCLKAKTPKQQAAGVAACTAILANFGVQKFSLKSFLPKIETLAGSTNPAVRNEVMAFFKEAYRWIRDAIMPNIEKLKKAQADELKKQLEEITDPPTISRFLKHEEAKMKRAIENGQQPVIAQAAPATIDAFDLAQPKDIFGKFNDPWCGRVLEMPKWQDRKEAMEQLNAEANVPRLADKSPAALVNLAKRLLNDSNVPVCVQAIKLVGLLSKGLRKSFELYARQFSSLILNKFKDKKPQIISEAMVAMTQILQATTMEQILDDIKECFQDKAPNSKTNVFQWILQNFDDQPEPLKQRLIEPFIVLGRDGLNNSDGSVRTAAQTYLQKLAEYNIDLVRQMLSDIPEAKKKKIFEGSAPPPQSPARSVPVRKEEVKKQPPAKTGKKQPSAAQGPAKKQPAIQDEDTGGALSPEEASNIIQEVIPAEIFQKLGDNQWKVKLEGLTELQEFINQNLDILSNPDAMVRFLRNVVKDWKENNFNVVRATFETITLICQNVTLSKRAASNVLTTLAVEKLNDMKVIQQYQQCLSGICEHTGPSFVIGQMIKNTASCNKPKVVSEVCNTIGILIEEYGVPGANLQDLLNYCVGCLNQANPGIKKGGQGLLCIVYKHIGQGIVPMLKDIKEATHKILMEEFSKIQVITQASYKQVKGEDEAPSSGNPLDAIPRNDISNRITSSLLGQLNDKNWKTRKEGLESVENLLQQASMRISGNGLRDLIKMLVSKLQDPNKSLVRMSCSLAGKFAEALGSESKQFAREVVSGLVQNLADKQALLRQEALAAIEKWAQQIGYENIITIAGQQLSVDNPEIRTELMTMFLAQKDSLQKADLNPMYPGLVSCLQAKNATIRKLGEQLFEEVVTIVGFSTFQPYIQDLGTATLNSLKPIFDKYKDQDSLAEPVPASPLRKTGKKLPQPTAVRKAGKIPGLAKPTTPSSNIGKVSTPGSSIGKVTTPTATSAFQRKKGKTQTQPEQKLLLQGNSNSKDQRLRWDAKNKWSVDEIREDFLERLKNNLQYSVGKDLYSLMFATDFMKQVQAGTQLQKIVSQNYDWLVQNIDLVFKWVWINLIDSAKLQVIKTSLELLQTIVNLFIDNNYQLDEIEAQLLLPIIVEKSGQNNATLRGMFRELIHKSCLIYPKNKVFNFVLQGLNSKNARTKIECLEEISALILDYGMGVANPRDIKAIAKFVNSQDSSVRTQAVNTMASIYKVRGEKIWNLIGEVPDKVKDILTQRFKTVTPNQDEDESEEELPIIVEEERDSLRIQQPPSESSRIQQPVSDNSRIQQPASKTQTTLQDLQLIQDQLQNTEPKQTQIQKPQLAKTIQAGRSGLPTISAGSKIGQPKSSLPAPSKIGQPEQSPQKTKIIRPQQVQQDDQPGKFSQFSQSLKTTQIMQDDTPVFEIDEPVQQTPQKVDQQSISQKLQELENLMSSPEYDERESLLIDNIQLEQPQTNLDRHMYVLNNDDMSSKVDSLVEINNIISNNLEEYREELGVKADKLIECLANLAKYTFDKPVQEIQLRFAKYFISVLTKVCSTRLIMRQINDQTLFKLSEQVLTKLLLENLDKVGGSGEGEQMIKNLNNTMLKVLEQANNTSTFVVLIQMLMKYKQDTQYPKMPGLVIRCLLKITKIIPKIIQKLEISRILIQMHEYLIQSNSANQDEMGGKTIKTILQEIVKQVGEEIWLYYEPIKSHRNQDQCIERWLNIILSQNQSVNYLSPRPITTDPVQDIFNKINDPSLYLDGIRELRDHLKVNPNSSIQAYMKDLSPELYNKVTRDTLINQSAAEQEPAKQEYNYKEFSNRIEQMKQRYGVTSASQNTENTLTNLKDKVNSLLTMTGGVEKQQTTNLLDLKSRIESLSKRD